MVEVEEEEDEEEEEEATAAAEAGRARADAKAMYMGGLTKVGPVSILDPFELDEREGEGEGYTPELSTLISVESFNSIDMGERGG